MQSLWSLIKAAAAANRRSEAIVAPGRPPLRYCDLERHLEATLAFLRSHGFGPRARIGVAMPPGPEVLVAMLATSAAATCAPLAEDLEPGTLERLMAAMRLDALVVPAGASSGAVAAARAAGLPLIELAVPGAARAGEHVLACARPSVTAQAELPTPDDLAFLWHTSGTTGMPRIVPFEQWRVCLGAKPRATRRRIAAGDRFLMLVPPSSSAAVRSGLLPALASGATVVAGGRLDGESLAEAIGSLAPTHVHAPPAVLSRLTELLELRQERLAHQLKATFSAYADMPPDVASRLETFLGVPLLLAYGLTETGTIAETTFPPDRAPPGSVGRPQIDVRVVDEAGRPVPDGEYGEIWVRGPEVIAAYERPTAADQESFESGWFRTGDRGRLDEHGFLFLSGRIKDLINRGGLKVAPQEVEAAISMHRAVRDVAVFGRPHPTLGEDLWALVVHSDGAAASEIELRRFARRHLAGWKVPSRIIATDAIPRGPTGKLLRAELRAHAEALARRVWQPPRNEYEAFVARLFAELLHINDVSRLDDFFERGGDSLRAVAVLARIEAEFGVKVNFDTLLDHADVAGLAAVVCAGQSAGSDSRSADR
jgi:acyl-CoA synthetase (AMP-forming)/AMP-acid ligase II/acyl carrier protein